jgi:IS1 family transposase
MKGPTMANILARQKQVAVIGALAEGVSIRAIERMTGIHRDTVMRLGIRVGQGCKRVLDRVMRNLACDQIQLDEIWGFIRKKQKNVKPGEVEVGDAWTFVAIASESKAVPCFKVGKRDSETAKAFVTDLSSRLVNRVQISTDALAAYVDAIEEGFGGKVDYAQIVKTYESEQPLPASSRYSPPPIVHVSKNVIQGNPEPWNISTSYIERQNLTMRMHCRRLTRLTNAFSKRWENFEAAVALHFGYYNLVKFHRTVRMTPAMAIKATDRMWSTEDLIDAALDETA